MLLLAGFLMSVSGRADAKENTRTRFPETVRSVKLVVDGPVVIHSGSNRSEVKVTLSDKENKKLRIAWDSDLLEIGPNALAPQGSKPKVDKVEIWMDDLRQVSVYGKSDVDLGTVNTTAFSVFFYGIGTLRAEHLDITTFNLQLLGVANADIKRINGTGMRMAIAGTGDINIGSQDITTLDMVLSGVGNADLGVIDATTVDINVAGKGHVKVRGDATTVRLYCGAGGSIDTDGLDSTRTIYTDLSKEYGIGSGFNYTIENPENRFDLEHLKELGKLKGLDGKRFEALGDSLRNVFDNIDWTGGKVIRPQKSGNTRRKGGGELIRP